MQTTAPHPLLAARRSDGKTFRIAFLCALTAHVAVFLLPLREERFIPDLPPETESVAIVPYDIKPPKIPENIVVEIRTEPRRVPVPVSEPEPEMLEPVEEPVMPDLPVAFPGEGELLLPDHVEPPSQEVHESGERDLVLPVRLSGSVDPKYPNMGRVSRTGGTVILQAVIDRSGLVVDVQVLRTPVPDLGFSEAAVKAVSSWRYRPGTINGRPVSVRMSVFVEFSLQ